MSAQNTARKSSTKDDAPPFDTARVFSYLWCEQSVQRKHPRPLPGKKLRVMRGEESVEILPCHCFLRRLPRFLPVGFDPLQKRAHFLELDGADGGGGVLVERRRAVTRRRVFHGVREALSRVTHFRFRIPKESQRRTHFEWVLRFDNNSERKRRTKEGETDDIEDAKPPGARTERSSLLSRRRLIPPILV